jgi:hypothetical protein
MSHIKRTNGTKPIGTLRSRQAKPSPSASAIEVEGGSRRLRQSRVRFDPLDQSHQYRRLHQRLVTLLADRSGDSEDVPSLSETDNESFQILFFVVEIEGRTSRCRYTKTAHQRLAAVMARPDRDALVVEDRR